jgi:DNA invertase Pin-like site-specific DNA recombinase
MNVRLIGYARCSTKEQCLDRQIIALRKFGVAEKDIVIETLSGKNFERPAYQKMIKRLKPGDVLVIDALDRLGRDRDALVDAWKHITKNKGADIVVLDMLPLLDTRQKDHRDITASFVADLVLQVLSYVSEKERLLNRERQKAGIAAAKARGVKFGNQPQERPTLLGELYEKWQRGEIFSREAGRLLGVSHVTFLKWIKDM